MRDRVSRPPSAPRQCSGMFRLRSCRRRATKRGTPYAASSRMTTFYPVHYGVERATRFTRLQLLIRVVAFCALGILGISFGAVFCFAYLALPVTAAIRLANEI